MSLLLRRGLALLLCILGANAQSKDCDALLVPDFPLPGLDTTTDLSYLSVVTADTFARHRANAYPKMSRVEVQLPIARELLQKSQDFSEFDSKRAQTYAEYGFNYAREDLIAHFRHLLPPRPFEAYNACAGVSGLLARVTKADRDFVDMALAWRAQNETPNQKPLTDLVISGATLLGTPPVALQAQGMVLTFARNLDADLRISATIDGEKHTLLVPRFLVANPVADESAPCGGAKNVVRALFRQTLGREPKPAELAAQAELLQRHTNSVRQLLQRIVLGAEYERTFVRGKPLPAILQGLYRHVLAREGDANGLTSNADRFANAAFATVAMTFLESHEYLSRFGDWTVPGSPPAIRYCAAAK